MKIICLHGTGANNEIFENQTATLRSLLNDFFFDFVEGTVPHLEGSWSRHYQTYQSSSKHEPALYAYWKLLDIQSMLEAQSNLLELLQEESPPFDGILAYSAGCALAAQAFLRHASRRNHASDPPLFKFAIFCNGVTPIRTFRLDEVDVSEQHSNDAALKEEALQHINLVARLRLAGGRHSAEQMAKKQISDMERVRLLKAVTLADGTNSLTDGKFGIARFDPHRHQISIPTLHIRDPAEPRHFGMGLLELCDPRLAKEYHHKHHHEFPRGYHEMQAIARLIRDVADVA